MTSLSLASFTTANNDAYLVHDYTDFDATFNYSWSAVPGTVSYIVELKDRSTQDSYSWETTNTSITAFGIPSGHYDLTISAKYANEFTEIVIVDDVML